MKKGAIFTAEHRRKLSEAKLKNPVRYWKGKKRVDVTGEKCHLWKGGVNPLRMWIRRCLEYRQWRSDVFTRDDFTCQICGLRGVYLEADHYPKGFAKIFEEYGLKTQEEALACAELWNLNNGRTLCRECHNKTKNRWLIHP